MSSVLKKVSGRSDKKHAKRPKVTYGANFISVSPDEAWQSEAAQKTSRKIQALWNEVVAKQAK